MKYYLAILIICLSIFSSAQDNSIPASQETFMKLHYQNSDIAAKMLAYDHVAWVSSDSVQTLSEEELSTYGGQWFCYLDSIGVYHALYGAYDSNYTLTAHYLVDSITYAVNRSFAPFDTTLASSYSKAYNLALSRKREFLGMDDRLRYNHFIFHTDSTISVHFVPAFQPNGYMIYGAEQHYTLNSDATKIIDTLEYYDEYRGYQQAPGKEITIGFDKLNYNSIGALFFLMYYEQYFKSITIRTNNYITTTIKGKDGDISWLHAERVQPKEKKKKKKKRN